eukprot:CAMPEP_0183353962 /NCGR_PEP_ID=MMETSP0164_2-20130417/36096_1 /TAXON_ID=221442 /ORGANISM="Coccolithus pelagicus ssp braarudi, Strain PLY182g" /LENGTH=56 /DNA_ID=CAMNT_0025526761 /DNA_START=362 /DNA_END=532 /DNA_ORIENTATION=-
MALLTLMLRWQCRTQWLCTRVSSISLALRMISIMWASSKFSSSEGARSSVADGEAG